MLHCLHPTASVIQASEARDVSGSSLVPSSSYAAGTDSPALLWWQGYNTDWSASIGAIERQLVASGKGPAGSALKDKTFLVIGAGGAGRALAFGAASRGAKVHAHLLTYPFGDCRPNCELPSAHFLLYLCCRYVKSHQYPFHPLSGLP